ncbi:MAG: hypothetical protein FWF53_02845 [Candidatus Azobacteroides sp.]|nr:hypothetical protein [Candidatus Azobacteroides sp.]
MNLEVNQISNIGCDFLETKKFTKRNQWYQLNKLVEQGLITKVKRGVYTRVSDKITDQRIEISKTVPSGVFCMFSMWQQYNLTTNNPSEFHIALQNKEKIKIPDYLPIKLYYWSEKYFNLGIVEIQKDGHTIKIYDLEKSVCDAVRFRNKVGIDIAIEVVRNYVKRKDRNFDKLAKYARKLRIENVMQNMIMPML